MSLIAEIQDKVVKGQFEFSKHAVDQSILRGIGVHEVIEAISLGEVIEDYPNDKYGPSCMIFGKTSTNRPIHVQCSYPSRPIIKVITVYQPDAQLWINFRVRTKL